MRVILWKRHKITKFINNPVAIIYSFHYFIIQDIEEKDIIGERHFVMRPLSVVVVLS